MKQNERKKQEKTETWLNVLDAQRMLLGFGTFRNSSSSRIRQRHVFGCMFVRWRERHVCVCKCVLDIFVLWLHYFSIPKKLSTFSTANQANQVSEPFFFRPSPKPPPNTHSHVHRPSKEAGVRQKKMIFVGFG